MDTVFFIEVGTRRVRLAGITANPTDGVDHPGRPQPPDGVGQADPVRDP
jgi:hypothetical protein